MLTGIRLLLSAIISVAAIDYWSRFDHGAHLAYLPKIYRYTFRLVPNGDYFISFFGVVLFLISLVSLLSKAKEKKEVEESFQSLEELVRAQDAHLKKSKGIWKWSQRVVGLIFLILCATGPFLKWNALTTAIQELSFLKYSPFNVMDPYWFLFVLGPWGAAFLALKGLFLKRRITLDLLFPSALFFYAWFQYPYVWDGFKYLGARASFLGVGGLMMLALLQFFELRVRVYQRKKRFW